jgi:hypothetical protein
MKAAETRSLPPAIKADDMKGFSRDATHAIMTRRGDAVLDLAASNLIR